MPYTGPFPYTNAGVTSSISVNNTTFSGNVGNTGTITGALTVTNSHINGSIFDSGFIGGGILVSDAASVINSLINPAIYITGSQFAGGISNAGTISSGASGKANAHGPYGGRPARISNCGVLFSIAESLSANK